MRGAAPVDIEQQNIQRVLAESQNTAANNYEDVMQAVLASSAAEHQDPNNPNVDDMSYEQLMALGERVGKVSTGCSKEQIDSLPELTYKKGPDFKEVECLVCIEGFKDGDKVKKLPCNHTFHSDCINEWLSVKNECPYCRVRPFE